jgi:hypothetical protein
VTMIFSGAALARPGRHTKTVPQNKQRAREGKAMCDKPVFKRAGS